MPWLQQTFDNHVMKYGDIAVHMNADVLGLYDSEQGGGSNL